MTPEMDLPGVELTPVAPDPHLVFKHDPDSPFFLLQEGENLVGRDECCEVQLDDESIAARHCLLTCREGRVRVEGLEGGEPGVRINCEPVERQILEDGDLLEIGCFLLLYHGPAAGAAAPALPPLARPGRRRAGPTSVGLGVPLLALVVGVVLGGALVWQRVREQEQRLARMEEAEGRQQASRARHRQALSQLQQEVGDLQVQLQAKEEELELTRSWNAEALAQLERLGEEGVEEQQAEGNSELERLAQERDEMAAQLETLQQRMETLEDELALTELARPPEPDPAGEVAASQADPLDSPGPGPAADPVADPRTGEAGLRERGQQLQAILHGVLEGSRSVTELARQARELATVPGPLAVELLVEAYLEGQELQAQVDRNLEFMERQVKTLQSKSRRSRDRARLEQLLTLSQKKLEDLQGQQLAVTECCQALEGGLREVQSPGGLSALVERFRETENRALQLASIAALRVAHAREAVPALVETLSVKDREVRQAALEALRSITGEDLGTRTSAWRRWLAEQEE